ncbi:polyprenyl synthetase family protein [Agromyces flavus]|uniref:polyprenyl synthetase family protein n=1 Tax=Agromyces flavus TaxID=589382 RepID=UPI0036195A52
MSEFSKRFLSGGKRFRAQFCLRGWEAVRGSSGDQSDDASTAERAAAVSASAALEVFHAAALVHDDLIDNSDTRRGAPSAHRVFESRHADSAWAGSAPDYGRATAVLLGDLLLGWSDELLDDGLAALPTQAARAARLEFNRMRTEVTVGQYLDILEERAWVAMPDDAQRERAERVVVFKSAKYSIEAPLVIGGAIAGGSPAELDALRAFGLPLGIAFQLRDDLLGVYGDPSVTGKPAGDDLREGKRTVLVAIARERLSSPERQLLDDLLGDPDLDEEQVRSLQQALRDCGAVDEVERIIAMRTEEANRALEAAKLDRDASIALADLAGAVTRRVS